MWQHPLLVEHMMRRLRAEQMAEARRVALLRACGSERHGLRRQLAALFLVAAYRLDAAACRAAYAEPFAERTSREGSSAK